jgi:hypothetical protein
LPLMNDGLFSIIYSSISIFAEFSDDRNSTHCADGPRHPLQSIRGISDA